MITVTALAPSCIKKVYYHGNRTVNPDSDFTYDCYGRLVRAEGPNITRAVRQSFIQRKFQIAGSMCCYEKDVIDFKGNGHSR